MFYSVFSYLHFLRWYFGIQYMPHSTINNNTVQYTPGTTWHSAGLVWRLRPSDQEIELIGHTRHLARDILEKETGVNPGWIENGGLFIANRKERLDEYKRLMTVCFTFNSCSVVTCATIRLTLFRTRLSYYIIQQPHILKGLRSNPGAMKNMVWNLETYY